MKRLSTALLISLIVASLRLTAIAQAPAPADFGSPPSGEIPILFNDHHVYSKPDLLRQGRVLAAIVRNGTILIPLRSMFEQMGATVAYDPASKTVDVSKPGSDIKVTVGRPEVSVNGESRPLDVPPIVYQGSVLVPIRVISEGMGAYVQWVPDKRLVVVRYAPATPPPPMASAPPAAAPTPATTMPPAPAATPYLDRYVAGDYIISPRVYNEFTPGSTGTSSYAVRGGIEFKVATLESVLIAADFRQYQYPHDAGFVTVIGGQGQVFVPAFTARDSDLDVRLGFKALDPHIYIGAGYIWRSSNYGYPRQTGFGYGAELLPMLNHPLSVYANVWYYPSMHGDCDTSVCPTGPFTFSYNMFKYAVGGALTFGPKVPIFLDFGYLGDNGTTKAFAPAPFSHNGPYAGLGIHF